MSKYTFEEIKEKFLESDDIKLRQCMKPKKKW